MNIREEIFRKENVVSVGIGFKEKEGKKLIEDDPCIIVGVTEKKSKISLNKKDLVPSEIDGFKTDVKKIGIPHALAYDPKQRHRPALGGSSISHSLVTAGTLGTIVLNPKGDRVILSNNHVMANSNNAKIGDMILQPGTYDGGTPNDQIAKLAKFEPISFIGNDDDNDDDDDGGSGCAFADAFKGIGNIFARIFRSSKRVKIIKKDKEAIVNYIDAAFAKPINDDVVSDEIAEIGQVKEWKGIESIDLGESIEKFGRTTLYTQGTIDQMDMTVTVGYGGNKFAIFNDQFAAGPISEGGDSGSLIVSSNDKKAVGLLFAGSEKITIINPIEHVIRILGIRF